MSKITFDFSGSGTRLTDAKIEIEARGVDIIYATAVLIDFLIDEFQKAEKESYDKKLKKVLSMVQTALDSIQTEKQRKKTLEGGTNE